MGSSLALSATTTTKNRIGSNPFNMGRMRMGATKRAAKEHRTKQVIKRPATEPGSASKPTFGGSYLKKAAHTLARQTSLMGKGGATAKYGDRGARWTLRFQNQKVTGMALALFKKHDKEKKPILMPGTDLIQCQDGLGFTFTWANEITGKSLHGWIRIHIPKMSTGGPYQFHDFWLNPVSASYLHGGSALPHTVPAANAANSYPPTTTRIGRSFL